MAEPWNTALRPSGNTPAVFDDPNPCRAFHVELCPIFHRLVDRLEDNGFKFEDVFERERVRNQAETGFYTVWKSKGDALRTLLGKIDEQEGAT